MREAMAEAQAAMKAVAEEEAAAKAAKEAAAAKAVADAAAMMAAMGDDDDEPAPSAAELEARRAWQSKQEAPAWQRSGSSSGASTGSQWGARNMQADDEAEEAAMREAMAEAQAAMKAVAEEGAARQAPAWTRSVPSNVVGGQWGNSFQADDEAEEAAMREAMAQAQAAVMAVNDAAANSAMGGARTRAPSSPPRVEPPMANRAPAWASSESTKTSRPMPVTLTSNEMDAVKAVEEEAKRTWRAAQEAAKAREAEALKIKATLPAWASKESTKGSEPTTPASLSPEEMAAVKAVEEEAKRKWRVAQEEAMAREAEALKMQREAPVWTRPERRSQAVASPISSYELAAAKAIEEDAKRKWRDAGKPEDASTRKALEIAAAAMAMEDARRVQQAQQEAAAKKTGVGLSYYAKSAFARRKIQESGSGVRAPAQAPRGTAAERSAKAAKAARPTGVGPSYFAKSAFARRELQKQRKAQIPPPTVVRPKKAAEEAGEALASAVGPSYYTKSAFERQQLRGQPSDTYKGVATPVSRVSSAQRDSAQRV